MAAAVSYMQADPSYRSHAGYAQSHVKHILQSPAHYLAAKKRRFSPTLRMAMGSALHCLVLEGQEQFDQDYILKPDDISFTTKAGKEWKAENSKKTILSKTDADNSWDAVHGMAESLKTLSWFDNTQPDYRKHNEVSVYWDADGLSCKGRLDRILLTPTKVVILDLKTTDTIDEKEFTRKIIGGLNYLFQSAWYCEGAEAVFKLPASFIFAAVERTPPYAKATFEVSQDMLAEGFRQTHFARKTLVNCMKTKQWPGLPLRSHMLELPSWYRSPLESATLVPDVDELDAAFRIHE